MNRLLALLLSFFVVPAFSQTVPPPKREFRAAWIATVGNIDWPSQKGLPAEVQRQQFISRLDKLKSMGCNAVIVQIRPASDAFYPSPYEPWSHYLSGKQGVPPSPEYDALRFMLDETHSRQMEFHAWFNPFRALVDSKKNPNPPGHVTRTHPEWIISYGGKSYIDPGNPAAREYVLKVISDVVRKYDIDAVHLDDYFYPYRIAGVEFGDLRSYQAYGKNIPIRNDWRRDNVNQFVQALHDSIRIIKPTVKFGISPFGVWRNASIDPARGSVTRGGQTCYDDLYANILLWLEKGWIDYVLPQLYWEHAHRAAAFEVLMPWWQQYSFGRHVYYGLGVYRMADKPSTTWASTRELLWEISDIRSLKASTGYSFYSASSFDKINLPIADSLRSYNETIALVPRMPWIDSIAPQPPVALKAAGSVQGTQLQWKPPVNPTNERLTYAVYRFTEGEPIDLERADKILALSSNLTYFDISAQRFRKCTYVVTALDKLWNESKACTPAVTNR